MDHLSNPKFTDVVRHFANSCKASREHSQLASDSLSKFGDDGSLISGVVRDHFPKPVKDKLRDLARTVTRESDAAYAARPKRIRLTTIRQIGNLVARRDGSGFYGPRA